MHRMVKEELLTFEGKPLFPERRAYTVSYPLSAEEARLYAEVTDYVREEMNRADRLSAEGEGRRGNVAELLAESPQVGAHLSAAALPGAVRHEARWAGGPRRQLGARSSRIPVEARRRGSVTSITVHIQPTSLPGSTHSTPNQFQRSPRRSAAE